MKNLLIIILLLLFSSCGKAWKEWMGEQRKIELDYEGQARLLQAENEKKIMIEDAKAELESAKLKAMSEVERAKGVAEANKIIGSSLKGNAAYLRYLWIQNMNTDKEVIYIPTEAGLPVLEAGKRK